MNDQITITNAPLKSGTALLAGLGSNNWSLGDLASLLAIIYTLILIGEWIYKRFIKRKSFDEPLETDKGQP